MKLVKLDDVCYSGSSNISQKDVMMLDGSYPIYGASGFIKNINFYKSEKPYIAIVKDGSGVGRTMILPERSSVIGTMQYIFPRDNIDIRYLYYAITSMDLSKYCTGIAIPHIYFKDYKKEKLNLPSVSEQVKIANKLDLMQKIIDLKQRQIEDLDELIKSQFVEMFENNTKCNLCDVAEIMMGQSPNSDTYNDEGKGIPFFQGKADFRDVYVKIKHYCTRPTKIAKEGDVLISVRAPVGDVNITSTECCIGRGLASVRPKKNHSTTWFLFYALKSIQKEIENKGTGSTFKAINKDILYKLQLPKVEIDRQNEFVKLAEQIDKQRFETQKSLEETQRLQESLMNKYFL